MLALVKAFLKAGVLTEAGGRADTLTGTPQGGILSPLLANIALTVLQVKDKIRALTNRTSQQDPGAALGRINQILRGWVNYFRHAAVCKTTLKTLGHFVWRRVTSWWMTLHRWTWTDLRRRFTDQHGRWQPLSANGIELFAPASVAVTRYRYRGNTIPTPWTLNQPRPAETVESPVR